MYNALLEANRNHVFTKDMSHEQWIDARKGGIGVYDAGAIMELNKWASALTVYLDKKGLNTFEGNTATEWGNWFEEPIRQ